MAFNNTDDHLRNHGFIRSGRTWRLSPAFDITPHDVIGTRATSLAGSTSPGSVASQPVELAQDFEVAPSAARAGFSSIVDAVQRWQRDAERQRMPRNDVERLLAVIRQTSRTLLEA